MKAYLKYGVSAIALVAALSLAQAQERQGGERGAGAQQSQGEQGGAMRHEGATPQHLGTMEKRGNTASERGNAESREGTRAQSHRSAKNAPGEEQKEQSQQREGERSPGKAAQQERGKSENRAQAERGKAQPENRQEMQAQGHRTAKNAPTEEQREQSQQREGERKQGTEPRQRESQAGAAGRSETLGREGAGTSKRASIHISGAQRTELHDVIRHDAGIHRYHRGEVHFSANVGTRVPDEIEFFAPPPRFVEIDPEFRYYKIIVLEDEILVVDPATREIVDVIPT